jgi:hypothetical protein
VVLHEQETAKYIQKEDEQLLYRMAQVGLKSATGKGATKDTV